MSSLRRPNRSATLLSAVVMRTQSDERLAALAAAGSEVAFEALVHRYRRLLVAHCRRLLLGEERAEDAVQQALLSAWRALRGGTEVAEVKAWLYRITHNHAVALRQRPGYDFAELQESIAGITVAEDEFARRALMRETLASLAALPELQREAILRTAVDGRSYEEVAAALGITDDAVRGLVYRARLFLRTTAGAIAPAPLVFWAAAPARRSGLLATWLGESFGAGGSVGGAAVMLKATAVIASSAAIVGATASPTPRAHQAMTSAPHHASVRRAISSAATSRRGALTAKAPLASASSVRLVASTSPALPATAAARPRSARSPRTSIAASQGVAARSTRVTARTAPPTTRVAMSSKPLARSQDYSPSAGSQPLRARPTDPNHPGSGATQPAHPTAAPTAAREGATPAAITDTFRVSAEPSPGTDSGPGGGAVGPGSGAQAAVSAERDAMAEASS